MGCSLRLMYVMKAEGNPSSSMSQCYHRKQRTCYTSVGANLARVGVTGLATSQWAAATVGMGDKCNVIKRV